MNGGRRRVSDAPRPPPEGARYLVLHCFTEVWRDDGERLAWESMGQYLDDIQLKLVPSAREE